MSVDARKTRWLVLVGGAILVLGVWAVVTMTRARPTTLVPDEDDTEAAAEAAPSPVVAPPSPVAESDGKAALAASLVDRLADLLMPGRTLSAEELREVDAIQARLAALGDAAVVALVARLDARTDAPGARELLFNNLRGLPGDAVEGQLVGVAKGPAGDRPAMRTMAIEALAARRTDRAFAALADIARSDAELPGRSLLAAPRDPADTSTELPDETVFSPRMQAMSALAGTHDPRAVAVLTDVARTGPDEALRMEAARNLESFRDDPQAREALEAAAASDPSAYVRLAALHALGNTTGAALEPLLQRIAAQDRDAGVRLLAQRLLGGGR